MLLNKSVEHETLYIPEGTVFSPHMPSPPTPPKMDSSAPCSFCEAGCLGGGLSLGIVPPQALASYDFLMLEVGTCPASPFGNLG